MRILCDTEPRPLEEIFSPEDWARLEAAHDLIIYDGGDRAAFYRQHLPEVDVIMGQQAMDREDIASARRLKAIFNVETNFLPNIDYQACFERGIHVLVASVTTENGGLLDLEKLSMMQPGAMLILLSRAAIADFDALKELAGSGRIRVATDVFPEEPVPPDPIRQVPNILFSAHPAGALTSALRDIGKLVLEDLDQISRGLPPVACKRAERETVGRMRSKPIEQQSTS